MKIQADIESKLNAALSPSYLSVINESHQHNVPANSETHFKVVCVSSVFEGLLRVKRHQQVYALLSNELESGVHALALHLYTSDEWSKVNTAPDSPNCMGGSKA